MTREESSKATEGGGAGSGGGGGGPDNAEIARILEEAADLLEVRGANPFRVRAYRNAARTVADSPRTVSKLVEEGANLADLPSIGGDLAAQIEAFVRTRRLPALEEVCAEVPRSIGDVMRIPGIGPKKARALWKELGVVDVDSLEEAARGGRVAGLAGFGAKTQEKILSGIEAWRRHVSRFRLVDADRVVRAFVEHLEGAPGIERVVAAGSYRRRRETVGDLDLLAVAEEAGPVMERFVGFGRVARVDAAGETKGSVVLESGLQVDLRIVPRESYGAALCYFTGSKAHNVKLRGRAIARGLRVSEYGVFRAGKEGARAGDEVTGERIAGGEEEEVYDALGLPWIAPELREDRGEIEAAEAGTLPELIRLEDVRGDLQMHSTWSDGRNSIEEMLEACEACGYEYFALTDHSGSLAVTGGLDEVRLREQWTEIDEIRAKRRGIRILRSLEVDILEDGSLDLSDAMLEGLDLVVVSVHSRFGLPAAKQTERILRAIRHPAVDILAHPTGRLINEREPYVFDLDEVLRCAADHGVAVELNANPSRLDLKDTDLMRACELGVKIVISTDAHRARDLSHMEYGIEQARRAWLGPEQVLNTLPLPEFLAHLGDR